MIAHLRGRVAQQGAGHAVIDVQGVGYLVQASARTLQRLPGPEAAVEILVDTHIGEETIRLYGFIDEAERAAFKLLQTVQGVGTRVALSILGTLGPDGLVAAVAAGDKAALARATGVGARLATRLATELKDRLGEIAQPATTAALAALATPSPEADDALAALLRLGFGRAEALLALDRAREQLGADAGLGPVLTQTLRELAPAGGTQP